MLLPMKPKLFKRNGAWCVVVPDQVWAGGLATGAQQGPFPNFEIAFRIAQQLSVSFVRTWELRNNQPIDIARVN